MRDTGRNSTLRSYCNASLQQWPSRHCNASQAITSIMRDTRRNSTLRSYCNASLQQWPSRHCNAPSHQQYLTCEWHCNASHQQYLTCEWHCNHPINSTPLASGTATRQQHQFHRENCLARPCIFIEKNSACLGLTFTIENLHFQDPTLFKFPRKSLQFRTEIFRPSRYLQFRPSRIRDLLRDSPLNLRKMDFFSPHTHTILKI